MDKQFKEDIERGLRDIGLGSGDRVVVHCSLKSLGYVDGGPETLTDAILNVVGSEGLMMMPTFTYSYEMRNGALPYNKTKTPSCLGLVSDVFWRREDAIRSGHPTHSVAAVGRDAEYFIRDHNAEIPPFNAGTPLHRLAESGGYILLIGVGHNKNSTLHVAEFLADLPFLHIRNRDSYGENYIIERDDGTVVKVPLSGKLSGCSSEFGRIERIDGIRQIQKEGYIGKAFCKLIRAGELLEILVPFLRKDPGFLLCDGSGECNCLKRRAVLIYDTHEKR